MATRTRRVNSLGVYPEAYGYYTKVETTDDQTMTASVWEDITMSGVEEEFDVEAQASAPHTEFKILKSGLYLINWAMFHDTTSSAVVSQSKILVKPDGGSYGLLDWAFDSAGVAVQTRGSAVTSFLEKDALIKMQGYIGEAAKDVKGTADKLTFLKIIRL